MFAPSLFFSKCVRQKHYWVGLCVFSPHGRLGCSSRWFTFALSRYVAKHMVTLLSGDAIRLSFPLEHHFRWVAFVFVDLQYRRLTLPPCSVLRTACTILIPGIGRCNRCAATVVFWRFSTAGSKTVRSRPHVRHVQGKRPLKKNDSTFIAVCWILSTHPSTHECQNVEYRKRCLLCAAWWMGS